MPPVKYDGLICVAAAKRPFATSIVATCIALFSAYKLFQQSIFSKHCSMLVGMSNAV